jgi:hypothetical protein
MRYGRTHSLIVRATAKCITRHWDANDGAALRKPSNASFVARTLHRPRDALQNRQGRELALDSVLGEDGRRDDHSLDFGRALIDLGGAHIAEEPFDG